MFERYRDIQERRKLGEDGEGESGFTLIELLIVIIVLGILAAIVVFSLSGVTGESKSAACTSDGKTLEIAADAFQAASPTQAYPADSASVVTAYLHSWPLTSNGYTLTYNTTAQTVDVNIGAIATAYPYTDPTNGCASLTG